MKVSQLLALLLLAFFSGCTSQVPQPKEFNRGNIFGIVLSGETKTTYMKTHGDKDRFCASRQVDAVETTQNGLTLGLKGSTLSDSIGEMSKNGALSLGGRDPMVLITRELMYRVCELSMNLNLNKEETIEMYKLFLKTVKDISLNEKSSGVAGLSSDAVVQNDSDEDDDDGDVDDDDTSDN